MTDPLDGLDDIDWAALHHAYGPATDVPGLLRALASPDPAERDHALDALYGGVHHQGDLYGSTLACLPFLCALAASPAVADRGALLTLLDSIGESAERRAELAEHIADPQAVVTRAQATDSWGDDLELAYGLLARTSLEQRLPGLTALLADAEPDVRAATAVLLAGRHARPGTVLDLITAPAAAREDDPTVRHAHVIALSTLAGRLSDDPPQQLRATRALAALAEPGQDPATELAALAALARHTPQRLPEDLADRATAALDRARQHPTAPADEPRPETDTLLSHLRTLQTASFTDDTDDMVAEALDDLIEALGDRVPERHRLVLHTLRHGDPHSPQAAVDRAGDLHSGWRVPAPDAAHTAEALGRLLRGPDPQLAASAAQELRLGRLPLSPDLLDTAARIADDGRYHTDWGWERKLPGQCIQLLAAAGDERTVGLLAPLLAGRTVPEDLALYCRQLRPHAHDMLPALIARAHPASERCEVDGVVDDAALHELGRLLAAMAATGHPQASVVIGPVLAACLDLTRDTTGSLHPGLRTVLSAPEGLGPDAEDALPVLRDLLGDPHRVTRVAAARALWHAGQDPAGLLPVLDAVIADTDDWYPRFHALELASAMGPDAAPLGNRVRAALTAERDIEEHDHTLVRLLLAARATAPDVRADEGPDDDLLRALWTRSRSLRPLIATALRREQAERALPSGFPELLHAELADPRRVGNNGDHSRGTRYDTDADDRFRTDCRALLAEAVLETVGTAAFPERRPAVRPVRPTADAGTATTPNASWSNPA
ncbi:hypothetical protein PUR71_27255 [Streptomyces sp. SP17BM10]|uniref:hypothetical protein n=1 Tax=Streptomyces sp. SP17BM10 TaxID=3002530 RepID=UPI002E76C323|nr:hypothetical protein [Streptomyces sp. SP17BM10]MEE1786571.1 hypothetical protein [Streptomyces sp. SP17BM10]